MIQWSPHPMAACAIFNTAGSKSSSHQQHSSHNRGGCILQGRPKKGFTPDRLDEFLCGATFTMYEFLMRFCGSRQLLGEGKRIHQHIVDRGHGDDRFLANLLVQMYGQCGAAEIARANGHDAAALRLFREMDLHGERADRIVLVEILGVCARLELLAQGQTIHARIVALGFDADTVAATAIFNMYARCGFLRRARELFDRLEEKSVVSWNAMITAYARTGQARQALDIFRRLDQEGIEADEMSYSGLLAAFAMRQSLDKGRILHARIKACGFEAMLQVANPLINMYGKCGCVEEARRIFDAVPSKNIVSWNTILAAYAGNGRVTEALDLFAKIAMPPDWISFCVVLQACSHAGLVDEAWDFLLSMRSQHGIEPRRAHYSAMVEIFGKAGKLEEAERLIAAMPVEPDAVIWRSLLGACKIHGDTERGTRAALKVIELKPDESGPYILLSNLHAAAGRLDELDKVRKLMKERRLGKSWAMDAVSKETLELESKQVRERLLALNRHMEDLRVNR
ncbi:pentatricopeptide repeat-containing protein At3g46790, chloroplastic [Selaginella moellendorffii]|uniref:pentatricopeptide repeat-containing protein At3g46790, chloroplastic n=1 Tax=Selaginella moellendorffii TaxID=88036 RepID=UPI000D1C2A24|nr:pentatricopeptide repeat-containing protein At3g46790, chloroplastic [Selaginella moellendorffii]|eukprot:XP_002964028.2 pentatricopeptide repeat-containing protein At3g46790, chloroplastic [Selaginella moellendorffii]